MKMWNFIKAPEFWITIVLAPLIIGLIINFFSKGSKTIQRVENKGGDIIIKAGDGGSQGKGGDINIGPGTYRAGDAVEIK